MNTQEIKENNKLIAEFMGEELGHEYMVLRDRFWTSPEYHSSWDWLIPVIDKITFLDCYNKYVDFSSSMVDKGGIHINTHFIGNTFENVIDFVKWYNANTADLSPSNDEMGNTTRNK